MNSSILQEKMELLRWIINLNDEQVIKNLVNFKNEIFGVPFSEQPVCEVPVKSGLQAGYSTDDPRLRPEYLDFGSVSESFLGEFEEALSLEEAKKQSIRKIQGWWRD